MHFAAEAPVSILFTALRIERRVVGVEVLGIQMVLGDAEGVAKTLIMHDLPLAKELNGVAYVGIVRQAQNVVVGGACFLLCCNCKSASFCAAEQRNKSLRDL